jgi:hypothetical protein
MRRTSSLLITVVAGVTALAVARPIASADAAPKLWKSSIRVNCSRFLRWFPKPTAKEPVYNHTSWYPRLSFTIQGPLEGGSQLSCNFKKPDGTVWVNQLLETPEIGADETRQIDMPVNPVKDELNGIIATGLFSFTVNLKNALSGQNTSLYNGKFKVGKFPLGSTAPKDKNNFEFYVDHDWTLPIGHMYFDSQEAEEAPRLHTIMWFRGDVNSEKLAAYVFYKGKQICSTKTDGASMENFVVNCPGHLPQAKWVRWHFKFLTVASNYQKISNNRLNPAIQLLDQNPGEYEIKVLREGKLVRTATFTVGPDGKIVDNGLAARNKMGGEWTLLPIKVVPGMDGKANTATYKADAFYGNPVVGFPD